MTFAKGKTNNEHRNEPGSNIRRTTMPTVPLIKANTNWGKLTPEGAVLLSQNVQKGIYGEGTKFQNAPITADQLKSQTNDYLVAIADAKDGSRKAIVVRNKK